MALTAITAVCLGGSATVANAQTGATTNATPVTANPSGIFPGPGAAIAAGSATYTPAPAATPALSYGVGEVVKMYQGGINKDVIVNFIANTALPYHLSADGIIYLQTLGVPQDITKAMIQRDGQLQQQPGNQQYYPPPQQPNQQYYPPPPQGNPQVYPPPQMPPPGGAVDPSQVMMPSTPPPTVVGTDYPAYYDAGYPYYGWPYYYGYGGPVVIGGWWGGRVGLGGFRGGVGGIRGGFGGGHGGGGGHR
jgi:hypothetical protein